MYMYPARPNPNCAASYHAVASRFCFDNPDIGHAKSERIDYKLMQLIGVSDKKAQFVALVVRIKL